VRWQAVPLAFVIEKRWGTHMPTNPNTWPTVDEVQNVFAAAGLMVAPPTGALANYDWQGVIDAAVAEWQSRCQITPFLATQGTQDFSTLDLTATTSDPFGSATRYLALSSGVISVTEARLFPNQLFGAVDTTSGGFVLQAGKDFVLMPVGAPGRKTPYTGIAFCWGHAFLNTAGENGVLRLTGTFGYTAILPADVRKLVLDYACAEAAPVVHNANFAAAGGVVGIKQKVQIAHVTTELSATGVSGTSPVLYGDEAQKKTLRTKLRAAAARYRQPVLV
jgi:hypothetical protein